MAWRHSGLSVIGTSHLTTGAPCQDAQAVLDQDGLLVLTVADGAGSARHADLAAALATARALAWFQAGRPLPSGELAWGLELRALLRDLRQGLADEAARLGCPPRELACTFLLALVAPEGLVGVQVGDGAIVYRPSASEDEGEGGGLSLLTTPYRGQYLNETVFLVSDTCLQEARFGYRPGTPTGLALLSDGLQMLALDMTRQPPVPHVPFFTPLFAFVAGEEDAAARQEGLRAFLASARVCARTDDDKTLVIAVPAEGATAAPHA